MRRRRDELVQPIGAIGPRSAADHARRHDPCRWDEIGVGQFLGGDGRAGERPALRKGPVEVRDEGSLEGKAGIAPRRGGAARPAVGDAEPGDEPDPAVGGEKLPVIAPDPERCAQARRVEDPDFHAGPLEASPEAGQRPPGGAEPVVEDPDLDARRGALGERTREGPAGLVVGEDEVFEVNDPFGRPNRLEPCRVILLCVAQEGHGVAKAQLAVGNSRRCPIEPLIVGGLPPMPRQAGNFGRRHGRALEVHASQRTRPHFGPVCDGTRRALLSYPLPGGGGGGGVRITLIDEAMAPGDGAHAPP